MQRKQRDGWPLDLLEDAARRARNYLAALPERTVAPDAAALAGLAALEQPFPATSQAPASVLASLDALAGPATVASAGPRYFGFVTGGSLPVALAANVLAAAWDQNGALEAMSPAAAMLERVAGRWLLQALALPAESAVGFTTGATMANLACLAAARHALLARIGYDVEAHGLFGAPPVTVIVGEEVHASLLKALALLGFGRARVQRVPVDGQGRMRAEAMPAICGPTLVCVQAGNVNTGACDPLRDIARRTRDAGAWLHVDGAFGLWAAAAPARATLLDGCDLCDSWATDAHKWLNVPYDSGVAVVREAAALRVAMASPAPYLQAGGSRDGFEFAPEMSRRARGVEVWAALATLGREGLADLVERCCRHARRFADGLADAGFEILNEVVLNQVLVRFGDDPRTREVIAALQADGTCWCGGTVWQGRAAMRISVSSWATTADDVERSLAAIVRVAGR